MTEFEQTLMTGQFVGIVEDNDDKDKKQRVRIRIPYLHGTFTEIPTDCLPYAQPKRDLNGLSCTIPDIGKIVNVTFPQGNLYYPIYDSAEHLNINLQKKLEEYSGEDYTKFVALLYNHNTQIYLDNQKGLFILHKFNGINIQDEFMTLNLKDNNTKLFLADPDANQELILGTHFMEYFDTLINVLMDPYIGNSGAPVIANPNLINVLSEYKSKRSTFLSKHIFAADNNSITDKTFNVIGQIGDKIEQTVKSTKIKITNEPIVYLPKPANIPDPIIEKPLTPITNIISPPVNNSIEPEMTNNGPVYITLDQLQKCAPNTSNTLLKQIIDPLNYGLHKYGITTKLRISHFLAQILHECGEFKYPKELGNDEYFTKYEGRKDLGNTESGDGIKFKGRGYIQLTGRDVYTKFSKNIEVDFVTNPNLLETPKYAIISACWFWSVYKKSRNMSEHADNDNFIAITKIVNGGDNGITDRKQKLQKIKTVFELPLVNSYTYQKYNKLTKTIETKTV